MCGRDPAEQKVRKSPHDRMLRLRQRLWREAGAGVKVPDDARVIGCAQHGRRLGGESPPERRPSQPKRTATAKG